MAAQGRLGAAVGEELDRTQAEPLVAVAGGQAVHEAGVGIEQHGRGVGQGEHGDGQRTALGEPAVGGDRAGRGGGVVHGGDALGEQGPGALGDAVRPALARVVGEGLRVRLAPGGLDQAAADRALPVAQDVPARRIGGRGADAERFQAGRIDQALMHRPVAQHDGAAELQIVEVLPGDLRAGGRSPVEAADPGRRGLAGGVLAERREDVVGGGRVGEVGPARLQRGDREVVVGVDQAGDEVAPPEVDAGRAGVGVEQGVVAEGADAIAIEQQDVGRRAGLHRADAAAEECSGDGTSSRVGARGAVGRRCEFSPSGSRATRHATRSKRDRHMSFTAA